MSQSEAVRADVRSAERKKEAEWSERKPTLAVTCAFALWLAGVWPRSEGEAKPVSDAKISELLHTRWKVNFPLEEKMRSTRQSACQRWLTLGRRATLTPFISLLFISLSSS